MPDHSVTDLSVAGANSQMFDLLYRKLPAALVLDFFDSASAWEIQHTMAERFAGMSAMIHEAVVRTRALRGRSEEIAQQCAAFVMRSNATLLALVAQLDGHDEPALTVTWHGGQHVPRDGRPFVVAAPHLAYFYAAPFLFAAREGGTGKAAVLGNVIARDALSQVFPVLSPRLQPRIEYIHVPSPTSARTALSVLQNGVPLVVFPEITQGTSGNVGSTTANFLDRRVWVPTTIARFARMARADIVPVLVTPAGHRQISVEVGAPLPPPVDRSEDVPVSLSLFTWLEQVVLAHPELWWGWPMLDSIMTAPAVGSHSTRA
jgi:lauroyl/myristoyl acyltransferase